MQRTRRVLAASLATAVALALLAAAPATAQDTVDVTVGEFFFDPFDAVVTEGTTVRWTNQGNVTHSVTQSEGAAFDEVLNPGDSFEFTFGEGWGEVNYFCRFHGAPFAGQNGWVTVYPEGTEAPDPRPGPTMTRPIDLPPSEDNVAAALTVTSLIPDGTAPTALVGRDDDFADLLAAGATGLPLLLTPTEQLDERVAAELQRLGTEMVFVVGGQQAVSDDVVASLQEMGITVERIAGPTRLETAAEIAREFFLVEASDGGMRQGEDGDPQPMPGALIARARGTETNPTAGFADSLGASAAGARLGIPVLVVDAAVPQAAADFLLDAGITHVAIVGGPAAVPESVEASLADLGITSARIAGASRELTAAELWNYVPLFVQAPPSNVFLIDGFQPDAWAAGFGAAALDSGVLLTNGDTVPDATFAFLGGVPTPAIAFSNIVCGTNVTDAACGTAIAAGTVNFISPEAHAAILVGAEETAGGAPVGNGMFVMVPVEAPVANTICYNYTAVLLETPIVGAHIHQAPEGEDGPVVVPLSTYGTQDGDVFGCATGIDEALINDLFANPGNYYVNVHTEQFPAGAIRDQLFHPDGLYIAEMSGDQEVGTEGDPQAQGFAVLLFDGTDLCFQLGAFGLQSPATAAHVHTGGPDEAGPVFVGLEVSPVEGFPIHHACVEAGEQAQTIKDNPSGHYVNVHTQTHPDGAIRGQVNELIPAGGGM